MHNDILRLEENNPSVYTVSEVKFTKCPLYFFKYLFQYFTEQQS